MKIFVLHIICLKPSTMEKALNDQVDKTIHAVDMKQSSLSATLMGMRSTK